MIVVVETLYYNWILFIHKVTKYLRSTKVLFGSAEEVKWFQQNVFDDDISNIRMIKDHEGLCLLVYKYLKVFYWLGLCL